MLQVENAPDTDIHIRMKMAWQQTNLRLEVVNSFANWRLLQDMHQQGRAKCISTVPKAKGPALILSSGSSLDKILPEISQWKGAIICSTTHGPTLTYYASEPTLICNIDPNVAKYMDELAVPPNSWKETKWVAHPGGPPAYLANWFERFPGEAWMLRVLEPTYEYYIYDLRWAYPWIEKAFHPFIDTVAMEIAIAAYLGYNPLYLAGADYGGARFDYAEFKDGKWRKVDQAGTSSGAPGPGGLPASDVMIYAMRAPMITSLLAIKERGVKIYQLAERTNLKFFPRAPWDLVLKTQGRMTGLEDQSSWDTVARNIEVYLARSNTYLVPIHTGFGVEHRVYMMIPQTMQKALHELQEEMLENKLHFEQVERRTQKTMLQLIRMGATILDKGEMLMHTDAELDGWDWHKLMAPDVEKEYHRLMGLWEEANGKSGAGQEGTLPTGELGQPEGPAAGGLYAGGPDPGVSGQTER